MTAGEGVEGGRGGDGGGRDDPNGGRRGMGIRGICRPEQSVSISITRIR